MANADDGRRILDEGVARHPQVVTATEEWDKLQALYATGLPLDDLLEWQALFAISAWPQHRGMFKPEHFRDADMRAEAQSLYAGEAPGELSLEATSVAFAERNAWHVARRHEKHHNRREFAKRARRLG